MADDAFFTEVATGEVIEEDVPRDGHGRYLLPDIGGDPNITRGRTRVTTVAGSMDNGYGLLAWRRRTVVRGLGLRPDLVARAGAASPDDPGYDKLLDSIEAAAFEAGGGSSGSNLGSAQHVVFDRYFGRGEPLEAIASYFHADIQAVERKLVEKKIKLVPGYNERVVYCRLYDRGGKIDALAELDDGTLVVLDWKTEKDPVTHPSGKTIQLAYYTNADAVMNHSTHQYEPMPPIRRDIALVVWCRPGSGEAEVYSVPVDLGWVGARVAEQDRAWRQQKIVIAPYMPGTAFTPAVVLQPQEIPGTQERVIANATQGPTDDFGSQGIPAPTQQGEWQPQPANGQGAQNSPVNGAGNAAQIKEIINQQIQSGQQIGPEQLAQMNTQAAAVIHHERPPGVPAGMVGHGPATQPPVYPGYTDQPEAQRPAGVPPGPPPPAPKGAGKNTPPAEYIKELIERNSDGIDLEAFYIEMTGELAGLSKKDQLQPMLRLIKPGIDENLLKKHREPLAELLVGFVKEQRAMRGQAPVPQETPSQPVLAISPEFAQTAQNVGIPVQPEAAAPWGQQAPVTDFVDMSYEGVMRAIQEAPNADRLGAIYQQWVNTYGPQQWTGTILDAANQKLASFQQMQPTH